jgi:hypothetical protein
MEEKNSGFNLAMFMLLFVGYAFFMVYACVIVFVILYYFQRFRSR